MKKYNLRINFFWDDGDDMQEFSIFVSNKTTIEEIKQALFDYHRYLDTEDETETYGRNGRNPETLLRYVCEENGWQWEWFQFDIDLNFD